ncbi:MAG TPA: IS4 family transposase [Anaerolineaceae bacterium]|nr:IS4 family transposase [Anaerolineaceae bacterium]
MDNRRVYRTIRLAMKQLFPIEPKGDLSRKLTTLAAMVSGIVLARSCQLPAIARKTPDLAKADSRIKRYSRWVQNERVEYEGFYLPFVRELLAHLAAIRELVFVIDGSEVGHECITLMISLIYGKRALPITWLVVKGRKGHLSERVHLDLLTQLQAILPPDCQMVFLGDGEFDGIELQAALQTKGWHYVCRAAKNTQLYEDGRLFAFEDLFLRVGDQICIPQVWFTKEGYGPVMVIARWECGFIHPIYLVTNFELPDEAVAGYKKRFQIETFFSDEKSRGFFLNKSHLSDPQRLSNLMIAACLAYLWIVYLGYIAIRDNWIKVIHRSDRCDWSVFRLGLALLDHFLNELLPIPASFNLLEKNCVR